MVRRVSGLSNKFWYAACDPTGAFLQIAITTTTTTTTIIMFQYQLI